MDFLHRGDMCFVYVDEYPYSYSFVIHNRPAIYENSEALAHTQNTPKRGKESKNKKRTAEHEVENAAADGCFDSLKNSAV